jgi:hypothetical protein
MNNTDKIRNFIVDNQHLDNIEVAAAMNSTAGYVSKLRGELRKEGKLPALEDNWRRKEEVPKATSPVNNTDEQEAGMRAKIKEFFKKKDVHTLEALSDYFDMGVSRVRAIIDGLIHEGHNFKIENGYVISSNLIEKSESTVLDVSKMSTGFYRFGAVGDNHLCSRYERLDVLNALYDLFVKEGIEVVYNTGNWIDGEARFNKHDLKVHGLDNQINYFIENYPQRAGIKTHYITGDDHEGWYTQREGINIGAYTESKARKAGREDLIFLGHMEADVILKAPQGQTVLRVLHPGGGSAYAISYTSQKIVESYTGGEKPDVLLDGHYHKAGYNYIRGVHVVQTGCTQDQTPFMRKKRLAAHLGGWIIEFAVDDHGAVTRFKKEFIPFYDTDYYKEKWNYKWQ